jgi:FkbM family methyltransferase
MSLLTTLERGRDRLALRSGAVPSPYPAAVGGAGAEFHVRSVDDFRRLREYGRERRLLELLVDAATEGDVVWDVGATIGLHSILPAMAGATVHAFEPSPGNAERLRENVALNDAQVTVHEIALGATDDEALLDTGRPRTQHTIDTTGERVPIRRGDGLDVVSPDVLKIDVEGLEEDVIDGARGVIEGADWISIEVHEPSAVDRIAEKLESLGHSPRSLDIDPPRVHLVSDRTS